MQPHHVLVTAILALAACTGGDPGPQRTRFVALDQGSACSGLTSPDACGGDAGCSWIELDLACPDGAACPSGACIAIDPCAAHDDSKSCLADGGNACDWAAVEALCPPGEACAEGGYCYQRTEGDACVCICPLMPCSIDPDTGVETCPSCECDCADGCEVPPPTCTCPSCPPGEACPECSCDGGGIDDGGAGDGIPGSTGGGEGAPAPTDLCYTYGGPEGCLADELCQWIDGGDCMEGGRCALGYCVAKDVVDPCSQHAGAEACSADADNKCQWSEACTDMACPTGSPDCNDCSGSCHGGLPDDGGCTCVCPAGPCTIKDDGSVECPTCDCTCDGGGGDDCIGPDLDGGPAGGGTDPGGPSGG